MAASVRRLPVAVARQDGTPNLVESEVASTGETVVLRTVAAVPLVARPVLPEPINVQAFSNPVPLATVVIGLFVPKS